MKKSNKLKKIHLETNENESTMVQNLCDAAKAVVRGKFIAIQFFLKRLETFQTNSLNLHLKQLMEKNKQNLKLVEGRKS